MQPNITAQANQAYQQSQQLQNQLNTQSQGAQQNYGQAYGSAQGAQGDLSNFTHNMQSGTDMYNKALQTANQNAGYDVNNLNAAQGQVSQLTGILGGLPRAVQASNANYGATAGQVANQVSTEGANLNQSLGLANVNTQNQLAKMQGGLTGAQQSTTAGLQGQSQQLQGYQATAQNATAIMSAASQTMTQIEALQQQQGLLTAQQQQSYAQAQQAYQQGQAALTSAAAAMKTATAQAALYGSQTTGQNLQNQYAQYANSLKMNSTPSRPSGSPTVVAPTNVSNPYSLSNILGDVPIAASNVGNSIGKLFGMN